MIYVVIILCVVVIVNVRVLLNMSRRIDVLEEDILDMENYLLQLRSEQHTHAEALMTNLSKFQKMKFSPIGNKK